MFSCSKSIPIYALFFYMYRCIAHLKLHSLKVNSVCFWVKVSGEIFILFYSFIIFYCFKFYNDYHYYQKKATKLESELSRWYMQRMQFTVKPRKTFSFLGKIRRKSNIFGYSNNKLVKDIKSQLLSLQQQIKHLWMLMRFNLKNSVLYFKIIRESVGCKMKRCKCI